MRTSSVCSESKAAKIMQVSLVALCCIRSQPPRGVNLRHLRKNTCDAPAVCLGTLKTMLLTRISHRQAMLKLAHVECSRSYAKQSGADCSICTSVSTSWALDLAKPRNSRHKHMLYPFSGRTNTKNDAPKNLTQANQGKISTYRV